MGGWVTQTHNTELSGGHHPTMSTGTLEHLKLI